jgi:hypothetical protein
MSPFILISLVVFVGGLVTHEPSAIAFGALLSLGFAVDVAALWNRSDG